MISHESILGQLQAELAKLPQLSSKVTVYPFLENSPVQISPDSYFIQLAPPALMLEMSSTTMQERQSGGSLTTLRHGVTIRFMITPSSSFSYSDLFELFMNELRVDRQLTLFQDTVVDGCDPMEFVSLTRAVSDGKTYWVAEVAFQEILG